jgi:hypothetical protein
VVYSIKEIEEEENRETELTQGAATSSPPLTVLFMHHIHPNLVKNTRPETCKWTKNTHKLTKVQWTLLYEKHTQTHERIGGRPFTREAGNQYCSSTIKAN